MISEMCQKFGSLSAKLPEEWIRTYIAEEAEYKDWYDEDNFPLLTSISAYALKTMIDGYNSIMDFGYCPLFVKIVPISLLCVGSVAVGLFAIAESTARYATFMFLFLIKDEIFDTHLHCAKLTRQCLDKGAQLSMTSISNGLFKIPHDMLTKT